MRHFIKLSIGKLSNPKLILNKNEIPVFMFHRVFDVVDEEKLDENIFLTKNEFEIILKIILNTFEIVCLDKLITGNVNSNTLCCVITFDDGWLDNYQYAFPIIKKYSIPVTIFLPTGFIGTSKNFWFEKLSLLINYINNCNSFKNLAWFRINFEKHVNVKFLNSNHDLYCYICNFLKKINLPLIDELLNDLECEINVKVECLTPRSILNWDEIYEMGCHGVTFGSHGVSHGIMTHMSPLGKFHEIHDSRKKLINAGINYVDCLSFPNGNYDQEILDISEFVGYKLVFSASVNKCGYGYSDRLVHRLNISKKFSNNNFFNYSLLKPKLKKIFLNKNKLLISSVEL